MPPRDFPVDADEAGSRLETFLRRKLGLARPVALKAVRKGWVRVDGRRAKAHRRLEPGEVVRITNYALPIPALEAGAPTPKAGVPAKLVRWAQDCIRATQPEFVVAHKPSGQVVHAGSKHPFGWVDALGHALGGEVLVPIGRLDRDTSGLLVLGRGRAKSRPLFDALRERTLARGYSALALGRVNAKRFEGAVDGRPAVTHCRTLNRFREATLVEATLETGRTHQIRVHLADAGHPLLGDPRYGTDAERKLSRRIGLRRLFLHAGWLRFPHPVTGEELTFEEPLPPELERALQALA